MTSVTINLDQYCSKYFLNLKFRCFTEASAQIEVKDKFIRSFDTDSGLKQDNSLASKLFNIALEYIIGKVSVDLNATLLYKSFQTVPYAEYII